MHWHACPAGLPVDRKGSKSTHREDVPPQMKQRHGSFANQFFYYVTFDSDENRLLVVVKVILNLHYNISPPVQRKISYICTYICVCTCACNSSVWRVGKPNYFYCTASKHCFLNKGTFLSVSRNSFSLIRLGNQQPQVHSSIISNKQAFPLWQTHLNNDILRKLTKEEYSK